MKQKLKQISFNSLEGVFFLTTGGESPFAHGADAVWEVIEESHVKKSTSVLNFLRSIRDSITKSASISDGLVEGLAYGEEDSSSYLSSH